jgi:hypothetical protein
VRLKITKKIYILISFFLIFITFFSEIASQTEDFSYADLGHLCRAAVRNEKKGINVKKIIKKGYFYFFNN